MQHSFVLCLTSHANVNKKNGQNSLCIFYIYTLLYLRMILDVSSCRAILLFPVAATLRFMVCSFDYVC